MNAMEKSEFAVPDDIETENIFQDRTVLKQHMFNVHLVATERVWSEFLRRKGQFGGRSLIISQRDALNVTPVSTLPPSSGPTPFIHRSILTAVPPIYRKRQFSP